MLQVAIHIRSTEKMRFNKFEDIQAWQDARSINKEIWMIISSTSLKREFALRDQVVRSSGSIMDNIAEGYERDGNKEFIHFLSIAKASCGELRSQLYRCLDREYITNEQFLDLKSKLVLTSKRIKSLMNYLKNSSIRGSKF